jgi:cobalt-zinc-cadmium efflux system membrane fusion protein
MRKVLLYIAIFPLLVSCKNKVSSEEKPKDSSTENTVVLDSIQLRNAGVVIGTGETKIMHTTLKVNGIVDVPPQSLISVSFPYGGYLRNTSLLPGYHVHKGQVLAIMEDQSYIQLQQEFLTTRARMEYLSTDVQRQKELSDADATSKKNYQLVLSDFKTQQVLLKSLSEKLRIININPEKLDVNAISRSVPIYSPIDGYVSKVNVNIGKYVSQSDVLFELINPEDIHAAITVFEKDITNFKKGLKGKVALVDKPNEWYNIEVILVTKNIDDNRTGIIHCHFQKPRENLLPGMYLSGVFELNNRSVTAVPEEAVVRYMGKEYVFIAKDDKHFSMIEVQTGNRDEGYIELKNGNAFNWVEQKLVIKGAYALLGKLKNKMEED